MMIRLNLLGSTVAELSRIASFSRKQSAPSLLVRSSRCCADYLTLLHDPVDKHDDLIAVNCGVCSCWNLCW